MFFSDHEQPKGSMFVCSDHFPGDCCEQDLCEARCSTNLMLRESYFIKRDVSDPQAVNISLKYFSGRENWTA